MLRPSGKKGYHISLLGGIVPGLVDRIYTCHGHGCTREDGGAYHKGAYSGWYKDHPG